MFDNVGKQIKMIAKWMCYFLPVLSIIAGLIFLFVREELEVLGYLLLCVAPLACWLISLFVYGFGEIVDTALYLRKDENDLDDRY